MNGSGRFLQFCPLYAALIILKCAITGLPVITTITVATRKEQVKTPNEEKVYTTHSFHVQDSIQNVWDEKKQPNTNSVDGICACKRINTCWLL